MTTRHVVHFSSSTAMREIEDGSIDLVVTSPPYPMIEMWDAEFSTQRPEIDRALADGDGTTAFEMMHRVLDGVWRECARVVRPGGFVCINVGDATRSLAGNFRLYTNHSRITVALESLGFQSLPPVLWRKATTAPNKFMGSGMLPSGAYVTLEHEYILLFRKGDKRSFSAADTERRRQSAFFWEERNTWFSDLWDLAGTQQKMADGAKRSRSAAFPFEIPFRLVNMYSLVGDTVLDPFLGTGTTAAACVAAARNSVGYEISDAFGEEIAATIDRTARVANQVAADRFRRHAEFVRERTEGGHSGPGYEHDRYGIPVMTRQERQLRLFSLDRLHRDAEGRYVAEHSVADPGTPATTDGSHEAQVGSDNGQLGLSFTG